jgi:hypothetical protein
MFDFSLVTLYFLALTTSGHAEDKVNFLKDTYAKCGKQLANSDKLEIDIALDLNKAFRSGVLPEWMTAEVKEEPQQSMQSEPVPIEDTKEVETLPSVEENAHMDKMVQATESE